MSDIELQMYHLLSRISESPCGGCGCLSDFSDEIERLIVPIACQIDKQNKKPPTLDNKEKEA